MKKKTIILTFITLLCLSWEGWTQNSITTLEDCLRQARENNLTLHAGRIAIEKAKDLQGTAFAIGKTSLALSQDPTSGGSPDNSLSLSQSFEFPTVYATRHGLLKAETEVERNRLNVSENEVIKDVTSLYYSLLLEKERIRILQQQSTLYNRFLFLASAKVQAGEANRLEQIHAERLCNENALALKNTAREYLNVQLQMQNQLNTHALIEPVEDSLIIRPISPLFNENWDASQAPQCKIFESQRMAGEKNLSLQRQGFIPEIHLAVRNQLVLKGFNPYDIPRERFDKGNFMGFEAGISVPLFFGEQRAKAKAAKREVEIIQTQKETALMLIQQAYETALNEYQQAKAALEYYLQTGNRLAEEITQISQLSYEKGEISYLEYIQNLQTAVDIRLQYAHAVNDYNQAVIILESFKF
jgi:cobalt-zinc-cadmium resistance protein CzcA